jgi:hypothetical protein
MKLLSCGVIGVTALVLALPTFAQDKKPQPKAPNVDKAAGDAPTLKDMQGTWIVDLEKLADTAHYTKHPDSIERDKKFLVKERFEFSEKEIVVTYDTDSKQVMKINSHQAGSYQERPALVFDTDMTISKNNVPNYKCYVFRRKDGALEVRLQRDVLTRPIKRKT